MASGGGGTQEQTATQITELPEWAKPYAKETLAKTQELTSQPYQTYGGERIAGFTPMQEQAQQAAGAMQVAPQIGAATGIAGTAGLGSLMAGQQYGQMATDPGSMQAYMSPYMQNVVDIQKREAQRQAGIAGTQRGAQAVRAGAFGGSRQAIMEAEAQRNLAQQMGDIQAKGSQAAFEQARQAQQFGAELGLRGLGQAGQMASTLGQLGQTQYAQEQGIINLQRDVGKEQQALRQAGYDIGYQDFLRQQQYPYQQLGFMADMIRGVPVGQTATTIYQQPAASPLSQLLGAGTAAYGAYRQFGAAEGGSVPGYAEGGGISGLNPVERDVALDKMSTGQMQGLMGLADISKLAELQVAEKLQQNAQLRKAVQMAQAGEQPQTTVAEEALMEMGLGGLDVPEDMVSAAEGGIISFQAAGAVPAPRSIPGGAPLGGQFINNPGIQNEIARLRASLEFAETDEERAQILAQIAQKEKTAPGIAMMPPADLDPGARSPAPAAGIAALKPDYETTGAASGLMTQQQYQDLYRQGTQDPSVALKGETEAVGKEQIVAAEARRAAYDKEQEELGVRGVEREKYTKGELEKLGGKKDEAFNMALIEAGLAIMSGNSANFFENVGKGALVGTKSYTNAMEKIESRRDKLNEALFALEDARFGDKQLSAKERRALEKDVSDAKIGLQRDMLGLKKLGIDYTNATAGKAVEAFVQQQRDKYTADRQDARKDLDVNARERLQRDIVALQNQGTPEALAEAERKTKLLRQLTEATTYGLTPATESSILARAQAAGDKVRKERADNRPPLLRGAELEEYDRETERQAQTAEQEQRALLQQQRPAAPAGAGGSGDGTVAKPLAVPKTKTELVKGQVYKTYKGDAVWDGTKFISVTR
jgi:hypothetical protein